MRAARGPMLHADVDCSFASVALRDRPDLADRPVAVVAHVFIASATYPAPAAGVRGGQHVDRDEVERVGDALFDVLQSSADAVEAGSIEEAFVDVGAADGGTSILRTPPLPATNVVETWHDQGRALLVGLRATLEGLTTPDRAGVPLL